MINVLYVCVYVDIFIYYSHIGNLCKEKNCFSMLHFAAIVESKKRFAKSLFHFTKIL